MAIVTGTTLKILVNQYDLTGYFRKMDIDCQTSMYDSTVFGSTSKTSIPGIQSGTVGFEGLFEATPTTGNPDSVFASLESASVVPIVSAFPEGWALGKRVYLLQAHQNKHDIGAQIDALIMNKAEFTDNDGYDFGVSLHALTAETSLPYTGSASDNGAATTNGGVAFLHVSAITGAAPSAIIKIQHAAVSTYADLVTFAAVTALTNGFQRVVIAPGTTINRNTRITITENGTTSSITPSVSLARR
jgi:hypothetical protein